MLRRQLSLLLAALLIGGGLAYGIAHLFALRLDEGDIYPAYSSLRPDPLGAKALLDAYDALPGVNAWRNYLPLPQLKEPGSIALFYVNLPHTSSWERGEREHLESLLVDGSRVVFAFAASAAPRPGAEPTPEKKGEKKKSREEERRPDRTFATGAKSWGFAFKLPKWDPTRTLATTTAVLETPGENLEATIPWHSELFFSEVKPPWKVLYRADQQPVLMERAWGKGSIVVAADAFFLSNEALRDSARAPQLLAHLLGSQRSVVFDENHLGLAEQSGVANLARKYRLHGLLAAIGLLVFLFIWQNLVRFVPPIEETSPEAATVGGRGSSEGFLALLRRSVPASQLLGVCLAEWKRSAPPESALKRLEAAYPTATPPPRKTPEILAAYRALAQALPATRSKSRQPSTS